MLHGEATRTAEAALLATSEGREAARHSRRARKDMAAHTDNWVRSAEQLAAVEAQAIYAVKTATEAVQTAAGASQAAVDARAFASLVAKDVAQWPATAAKAAKDVDGALCAVAALAAAQKDQVAAAERADQNRMASIVRASALAEAAASKRAVVELWKVADGLRVDCDALRKEVADLRLSASAQPAYSGELHRHFALIGQMVDTIAE